MGAPANTIDCLTPEEAERLVNAALEEDTDDIISPLVALLLRVAASARKAERERCIKDVEDFRDARYLDRVTQVYRPNPAALIISAIRRRAAGEVGHK
jgi:hypothetical protein